MWPRRSDVLNVLLSSGHTKWRIGDDAPTKVHAVVANDGWERVAASLVTEAGARHVRAVHVVADSSVARHWMQVAPVGLRSLSELRALVQSRADMLFGGQGEWAVTAGWDAWRTFLCAAVPNEILLLASAVGKALNARPEVSTLLLQTLHRQRGRLPADGWVVVQETGELHLLYLSKGEAEHLRTASVPTNQPIAILDKELLGREIGTAAALAGGLPTGPVVVLSCARESAEAASPSRLMQFSSSGEAR